MGMPVRFDRWREGSTSTLIWACKLCGGGGGDSVGIIDRFSASAA